MVEESHNTKEHDEQYDSAEFDDEELDEELLDLASSRRQGSLLRPILFIVVIWFGVSVISDWQTQLAYFFSSSEPVEIGSVTDFPAKRAQDPNWEPEIPHNRYVSIEGVPSKRAQSKRYKFFKLVGDHVYIEVPRDIEDKTELELEFQNEKGEIDRTYFEGAGRALHLSKIPGQYQGLRSYYYQRYNTNFCGMQLPEKERRAAEATGDECVDAYLVETQVKPSDHWWYLVLSGLIGLFILLNVWWLFRWIRDFVRK
ncbi:hypothetical protein FIV42_10315 [Persicimonas caeni]|uniref:Uncharacterized protein n=1 Tax=Persicimonas caeni TaxID=2292766 RepID=A0A4Y6PSA6_PERCE|nr:hypothetical protein [Persicimonas caeni]QDG51113.1 hypothetical protein FIV42_10315 [Persicimonas caeni]QED32334.1 hypothetical protein FRD00_10310 [Persicimonas caeni]